MDYPNIQIFKNKKNNNLDVEESVKKKNEKNMKNDIIDIDTNKEKYILDGNKVNDIEITKKIDVIECRDVDGILGIYMYI
jgi:hypothetical protein